MKYFLSVMITFAVLLGTANIKTKNKKVGQNFFQKRLERLGKGFMTIPMPNGKELNFSFSKDAIANESECDAVLDAVDNNVPNYEHGALGVFNRALYYANNMNAADVENIFCHFVNTMELDGEVTSSPVEKVLEGTLTVRVSIEETPIGGFEETEGYSKKATIEVAEDGSTYRTYMVMYWGFAEGSSDTTKTKGFLIEGAPNNGLSSTRASYMQWDLTGTTQTGRFLAAEFPSGENESDASALTAANYYVTNTDGYTNEDESQRDRAVYGRFSVNTSTNVVHVQGLTIESDRRQDDPSQGYGCFKFYGTGVKGGMMVLAKSRDKYCSNVADPSTCDSFSISGHFTDGTSSGAALTKDVSDMDAACLPDLTSTENLKGNIGKQSGSSTTDWEDAIATALATANGGFTTSTDIFDISCADLNSYGTGSGPFSNGVVWVDFASTPSDVFNSTATDLTAPSREQLCSSLDGSNVDTTTKCYCPSES